MRRRAPRTRPQRPSAPSRSPRMRAAAHARRVAVRGVRDAMDVVDPLRRPRAQWGMLTPNSTPGPGPDRGAPSVVVTPAVQRDVPVYGEFVGQTEAANQARAMLKQREAALVKARQDVRDRRCTSCRAASLPPGPGRHRRRIGRAPRARPFGLRRDDRRHSPGSALRSRVLRRHRAPDGAAPPHPGGPERPGGARVKRALRAAA